MSVKKILLLGNEVLRQKAESVDFDTDPVDQYIVDLSDTLHNFQKEKKIGRAIAGPQIGYQKKIIRMEMQNRSVTMINPHIVRTSKEKFEVWDSCFSADVAFFGKTLRFKEISVLYFDENGQEIHEDFSDDLSELFQHEIDHLDGVLFTDRIMDNQIMMREEWEKLSKE